MRFPSLILLLALSMTGPYAAAADLWHSGSPQILSADEAFGLLPAQAQNGKLRLEWEIAPGYYLYRGRLKFEAVEPAKATLGTPQMRAGEKIHDEHFGDVEIYRGGSLTVNLPATGVRKLKVSYQGCAEAGVCLPPQTRVIDVPATP